jgi:hypothetical protein
VANSVQAANQIADIMGKKPVTVRNAARRLGEEGLIPRGSRGRTAHQVDAKEVVMVAAAVMAMTDNDTLTIQTPQVIERIVSLDKGLYPEISLMDLSDVTGVTGEPKQLRAFGSFVETFIQAIEGHVDPETGPVQALGLQFCRGIVRPWVDWKLTGKVFFGVRELPPGMIQEAVIKTDILDALRQIPTKTPSVAADGPQTTTPTQFAAGSASVVSSESHSDTSRDAPLIHHRNMRENRVRREKNQALDSGRDSPSINDFGSEREPDDHHTGHRRVACA